MPRRNRRKKQSRRSAVIGRRKSKSGKSRQAKTLSLANPSQKKSKKHLDVHHRRPQSKGGLSMSENLSMVDMLLHRAWHILFVNYSAKEIAAVINSTWLDPRFEFVVRRRHKSHLRRLPGKLNLDRSAS
jgi:hypothetical protein